MRSFQMFAQVQRKHACSRRVQLWKIICCDKQDMSYMKNVVHDSPKLNDSIKLTF